MADEITTRNVERIRELYRKFSHIDPDELASFFTDNGYIQPMMKDPYAGHDEIRRMFGIWASQWSGVETPLRNIVGTGDVVMTEWSDESSFDGKRYVIPCTGVFEFEGEKIKAWRLYYDYAAEPQAETGLNRRQS
jgi:limonene-1,2-epoxide hydrolase